MKKLWVILVVGLLLTGCGTQGELETVLHDCTVQTASVNYQLQVALPEEASTPTMVGDAGKLYFCDSFSVSLQKLPGGDIGRTMLELSGMGRDRLSVIKTEKEGVSCYRFAWSAAGEGTEQSCCSLVLDDGIYHHAVTVMADHALAGSLRSQWNSIFDSAALVSIG